MKKAVYIGAGIDIIPVLMLSTIKEFIYIDSQPFSEHGTMTYSDTFETKHVEKEERFTNLFSRPNFIPILRSVFKQNDFTIVNETADFILFNRKKQTVKYYYSCAFPEYVDEQIRQDLIDCDTLILCGYDPNKIILDYIQIPTIITNSHTIYDKPEDSNSLFAELLETPKRASNYLHLQEQKAVDYWIPENLIPSIVDNYKLIEASALNRVPARLDSAPAF
jgi:hypothetical protein